MKLLDIISDSLKRYDNLTTEVIKSALDLLLPILLYKTSLLNNIYSRENIQEILL